MVYNYKTRGTCASAIEIDMDENHIINSVRFSGGCNGNTKGIASLVKGMKAEDVIERTQGIRCGFKPTSCPDQLASALKSILGEK